MRAARRQRVVSALFPASGVGGRLREGVARWPWTASGMGTDENITCHPGKVQFTYHDYAHTE
jgi:hypothetical protein